jgi:hypothetical protein
LTRWENGFKLDLNLNLKVFGNKGAFGSDLYAASAIMTQAGGIREHMLNGVTMQ